MRMTTKVMTGIGGAIVALSAGSGIAAAEPDIDAIANSKCTYPQVIAAVTAQDPAAAQEITSSPIAVSWLQQLEASNPQQRRDMIAQVQGIPQVQQYAGLISTVTNTCGKY